MTFANKISYEFNQVVARSREIAIDMGYDYMSTLHIFIADCERKSEDSIFNFAFKSIAEYEDFKKHYVIEKKHQPDLKYESLPLTVEAETTFKMSEEERVLQDHNLIYSSHWFIAALKNETSDLYECFKHDDNALNNLIAFYKRFDEINKVNIEEVVEKTEEPKKKEKISLISSIKRLFK